METVLEQFGSDPDTRSNTARDDVSERARLRCRRDCLVAERLPGSGPYAAWLSRVLHEMSARGVRIRVLWPGSLRIDDTALATARSLVAMGAHLRVSTEPPEALAILDGDLVVALEPRGRSAQPANDAISLVSEPPAVAHLQQIYERAWREAIGFLHPDIDTVLGETGRLEERILAMLAEGHTDETMSRRLGISPRTCRRHLARVMQSLGATSRFQAGVLAERAGRLR